MSIGKSHEWLQIVGAAGVIAGLALVAYEIRENNRAVSSESIRSLQQSFIDISISEIETGIYDTYVKSFERPDELTSAEMMELHAWLTSIMSYYLMWFDMHAQGRSTMDGLDDLKSQVDFYFGSEFSRAWWLENKTWLRPEIRMLVDGELEERPVLNTPPTVSAIKSRLSSE